MRENKEFQIKFRLTASQKAQVDKYCAAHNINTSQLMRLVLNEYFNKENNKNDE